MSHNDKTNKVKKMIEDVELKNYNERGSGKLENQNQTHNVKREGFHVSARGNDSK